MRENMRGFIVCSAESYDPLHFKNLPVFDFIGTVFNLRTSKRVISFVSDEYKTLLNIFPIHVILKMAHSSCCKGPF